MNPRTHDRSSHLRNFILAFLLVTISMYAQVPRTISFQGVLSDAQGNLVPDGNHQLQIVLYDQATNGNQVFVENQTVPVVKGIFNVIIGSVAVIPQSLSFDRAYFLGVRVDGGGELTPRTALTSVPYSLRAERANIAESLSPNAAVVTRVNNQFGDVTLLGAGGTTVTNNGNAFIISSSGSGGTGIQSVQNTDGTITIQNPNGPVATIGVNDGAITDSKIASGQVVKSINTLKDDVTLTGGSNVTITPNGNALTIATTGGGSSGVSSINNANGALTLAASGGATVSTNGKIITINAGSGSGGTGIQGIQNTDNTLDITNPGGPTATINVKNQGIGTTQLADNAVTSAKIQDAQVQGADLANGAVATGKLADNAVTSAKIANGTITGSDISSTTTITVEKLQGGGTTSRAVGVYGSGGNSGVYGTGYQGVYGEGGNIGVRGVGSGVGVIGESVYYGVSGSGDERGVSGYSVSGYGVYGDGGVVGVYGSSSSGFGVYCNGKFYQTGGRFEAHPTSTTWTTNKPATVKLNDGSQVKLFSEEAAEVYFSDYGEAQLSNGRAHIELESQFLQTVTIDKAHPLKVFVQLADDCNGVFVTNRTSTGFDVVELQNGKSNAAFFYRVVCKRKYYEDERLATEEQDIQYNKRMMETVWPEVIEKQNAEREKMEKMTSEPAAKHMTHDEKPN